ncbi:MAG: EAL domain-containing protein [Acidobacteriaceae bacterium]
MAFQPIVDLQTSRVTAYEALVRGNGNEPASSVLHALRPSARIDRACRLTAIEVASSLGLLETGADLCINVNPRVACNDPASIPQTIAAADRAGLPLSRLVLEITEVERLRDPRRLQDLLGPFRDLGLRIAIDDFGAGFAGLSLLAAFHPDLLKIDIALTRKLHERRASRVIVGSVARICEELDIQLIAEGVEEAGQVGALQDLGIRYMQGHHFAAPAFEALPAWPA